MTEGGHGARPPLRYSRLRKKKKHHQVLASIQLVSGAFATFWPQVPTPPQTAVFPVPLDPSKTHQGSIYNCGSSAGFSAARNPLWWESLSDGWFLPEGKGKLGSRESQCPRGPWLGGGYHFPQSSLLRPVTQSTV